MKILNVDQLLSEQIRHTPPSFIRNILNTAADPEIISFAGGLPNPASFPEEALLASMERIVCTYKSRVFQYSVTAGLPELREAVALRYRQKFGLNIGSDHVLITTGSQQALDLLSKVLLNPGDGVIIEKPSYLGALQAFSQYRPVFHPVELTEDGMDPNRLEDALRYPVKFLYAIPDFQNPTGLSYSAQNREKLRELLSDKNLVLVEDDPYGELRFEGSRLPYIGAGRLPGSVLLGTFSKTVTPGMRVGYLICENKELIRHLSVAKEASDLHTNIFAQYLIWDYLQHNDYEAHIASVTALYKRQAQAMTDAIDRYFPPSVKSTRPRGGMFLWITLPKGISALSLFTSALEKKVAFVPGDPFYIDERDVNAMRLNYSNADCPVIEEGIRRLGELLWEKIEGTKAAGRMRTFPSYPF